MSYNVNGHLPSSAGRANGVGRVANGLTRRTRRVDGEGLADPDRLSPDMERDAWEAEKRTEKNFSDDGTMTFFWRSHRIIALLVFIAVLLYVALVQETPDDWIRNTKRGLVACVSVLLLLGVTHIPDGVFRRPHPAFWKLVLVTSVVYELFLVFLLFQTADGARTFMHHLDPELGVPVPDKDYGGNCRLYDHERPDDPWHHVADKLDEFVLVHFFGWWFKTLVLRDYWLCVVISVMFELLEYTLEHQLPNFSECWWDHWVMDALVCNGLGILFGMKTLQYLNVKKYHWRGTWNINTYSGKMSRIVRQFTPYFWTEFDWRPTSSLRRWMAMLLTIAGFLLAEINGFYMKNVLYLPSAHYVSLFRLGFFLLWAAVGMREFYQYLEDKKCTKIGTQYWINMANILTESFIVIKFDWATISKPLPRHVAISWIVGLALLLLWTLWYFYLHRLVRDIDWKLRRESAHNGKRKRIKHGVLVGGGSGLPNMAARPEVPEEQHTEGDSAHIRPRTKIQGRNSDL